MTKKVLILSTSPRIDSNSEILANTFLKGARSTGNEVEFIRVSPLKIQYCQGCLKCQEEGICVINDHMSEINEKIKNANVIVFATPIYFYSMSGQMKTLLDRTNPLFNTDYRFTDIYLIATSADGQKDAVEGTVRGIQGWIDCFENVSLKEVIHGGNVTKCNDIKENDILLKKVFDLGSRV